MPACLELEKWFDDAWADPAFRAELDGLLRHYGGRPTPVTECTRLSERLGVRVLPQAGGPGPHGLAQAQQRGGPGAADQADGQVAHDRRDGGGPARRGLGHGRRALRPRVHGLHGRGRHAAPGAQRLPHGAAGRGGPDGDVGQPDAQGRGQRGHAGVGGHGGHHALLPRVGHGAAPVPLHGAPAAARRRRRGPRAVRASCSDGAAPDVVVACIGGGSNAAGTFAGFVDTPARLVGVEAAGGAAITNGIPGVLHGMHSRLLQDEAGQIQEAESISAGLDYPGLGPEHAHLAAIGRAEYSMASDDEVLEAFRLLSHTEGIIPALESAHAVAWVARSAGTDAAAGGLDGAHHAVGPGRQGRRPGARDLRSPSAMPDLEKELRARRERGRKLLIPYLMGGMTDDWTQSLAAVIAAGADAVEVGIPFSDPMMDGPVIQEAALRALTAGHGARPGPRRHCAGGGARADGGHDLLQPRLPGRAQAHGAVAGRRRRQRGDHRRPPDRGDRPVGGRGGRRGHRHRAAGGAVRRRPIGWSASAPGRAASSTPWPAWG